MGMGGVTVFSAAVNPGFLQCATARLSLATPAVMGVLNITPDSFSDGGQLFAADRPRRDLILRRATRMVTDGAVLLDVGGESTRPGAAPVSTAEELERVLPVVEWLRSELDVIISVDTSTPELMGEAARLGAGMINDVRALSRPGALQAAAQSGLPVCLMHMQGSPADMQQAPSYRDVVGEVRAYLRTRVAACLEEGIAPQSILLDPGFGFGKTLEHNLALLRGIRTLAAEGFPMVVGLSRKSMIGALCDRPRTSGRLAGGLALATLAVDRGASIVRTHDVRATVDAVTVAAQVSSVA